MATKAQRLNDKLNSSSGGQSALQFPSDLGVDGHDSRIKFKISLPKGSKYLGGGYSAAQDSQGNNLTSSYRQPGNNPNGTADRFSKNFVQTQTMIDLYMPPMVQTTYNSNWASEEMGLAGTAMEAFKGFNWADRESQWQIIKNSAGESAARTLTAVTQTLTPVAAESMRAKATSTIVNPYMEVIFNGISNRSFSFVFKMIPRNASEQASIKKIVDEFKFHRAPELKFEGQSNYWLYPSEFDIEFHNKNGINPFIFKISTCALTDVTVNYTPDGQYATYNDGSPFATELTLTFLELEILTKEKIKEGY